MKIIRRLIGLVAVLVVLAGLAVPVPAVASPNVSFVVNTNVDAPDSNLGDGICYNTVLGNCTLRAALQQAFSISSSVSPVTITFSPDVAGQTFFIGTTPGLGALAWNANFVTLDGGGSGIIIDGSTLAAGQDIFRIAGSHNTLMNLTIRAAPESAIEVGDLAGVGEGNFNLIDRVTLLGGGVSAVNVRGSSFGGTDNIITNSRIGLSNENAAGCVSSERNGGHGVNISAGAHRTQVIASYIGCNNGHGVNITSGPVAGSPPILNTRIANNLIGLGLLGGLPNQGAGIVDQFGANTVIDLNNIGYNQEDGILLIGAATATVTRNQIHANVMDGVKISAGATGNWIGSDSDPLYGNTISENHWCGVRIQDSSTDNFLNGNMIGTDASGTMAAPNLLAGVCIFDSNNNSIGTSSAWIKQVISGNAREGVYLQNSSGNFIGQTTWIGVDINGTGALGNGLEGVRLVSASNTGILAKYIAYNRMAGIAVEGDTSMGNRFTPLNIYRNGGLPIDLGNDGETPNGVQFPPGPNNWQAYPVITDMDSATHTLSGTTCSNCSVYVYRAVGDPRAKGGGGILLTQTTANASGKWTVTLGDLDFINRFTTIARQPGTSLFTGDGSEMSLPTGILYLPVVRK